MGEGVGCAGEVRGFLFGVVGVGSEPKEGGRTLIGADGEGGGHSQVSTNGGCQPRWSKDGKELFYVERDTLMAVAVSTTPSFTSGAVTRLFQDASLPGTTPRRYDVSADGRRFVLTEPFAGAEEKPPSIHIVENWFEEFKDRPEPRP